MSDIDDGTAMIPMNLIDKIDELRRVCRIDEDYQVEFIKDLRNREGIPIGGRATVGGVELNAELLNATFLRHTRFPVLYLHEVAHVITFRAELFHAPDDDCCPHSRFFAVLLAVLYRRAGLLAYLSVYEFADSPENWNGRGTPPDDSLLIRRFAWIMRRSAQLAALPLSIEGIADVVYREDLRPAWIKVYQQQDEQHKKSARWLSWLWGA